MHIGLLTETLGRPGGGLTEAVRGLARTLAGPLELKVSVFGLQPEDDWGQARTFALPYTRRSSYLKAAEISDLLVSQKLDLLHVHGLWSFASAAALKWQRATQRPLYVSPHGMLDAWALSQSRLRKQLSHLLLERHLIARARCLHALCATEAEILRQRGYENVLIIPNGVEAPPILQGNSARPKRMLYLGRLHQKKNVHGLICAWNLLAQQQRLCGWVLTIAGWGDAKYLRQLQSLAQQCKVPASIVFAGPVFGEEKAQLFLESAAFVLPSFSEGFPMAALEAAAHALPLIATVHCNLDNWSAQGLRVDIGTDAESIATGLASVMTMPDRDLENLGTNGRALVLKHYTWPQIAQTWANVYSHS